MEREAASLSTLDLRVERLLTSPLLRARQTAEIVARGLSIPDMPSVDQRLSPGFGVKELAGILRDHGNLRVLMLVGHEPDFSTLISACIGGGSVEVKKGSLARVDIDSPASLRGRLAWLVPPRLLAPEP